jgi:cell division protein FtsB
VLAVLAEAERLKGIIAAQQETEKQMRAARAAKEAEVHQLRQELDEKGREYLRLASLKTVNQ